MLTRTVASFLIATSGFILTSCADEDLPRPKRSNPLASLLLEARRASDDDSRYDQLLAALWHKMDAQEWTAADLAGLVIDAPGVGPVVRARVTGPIGRANWHGQEAATMLKWRVRDAALRDHPSRVGEPREVAVYLAAALRAGGSGTLRVACTVHLMPHYGMSQLLPALEYVLVNDEDDLNVLAAAVALLGREPRTMPKTEVLLAHLVGSDSRVATAAAIGLVAIRRHLSKEQQRRIKSVLTAARARMTGGRSTPIDKVAAMHLLSGRAPSSIMHSHF